VDGFEPTKKFKVLESKSSAAAIVEEITEHVAGEAEAASRRWYDDTLQPMLHERLTAGLADTERDIARLFSRLDTLRAGLFAAEGDEITTTDADRTNELALAEPDVLVGVGADGIELANVRARLGGAAALAGSALVLATAAPIALLLLAPAVSQVNRRRSLAAAQIKETAGKELSRSIRNAAGERSDKVAAAVGERCDEVKAAVVTRLDRQIAQATDQIDAAVRAQHEQDEERERQRAALEQIAERCSTVISELDTLVDELSAA
jgi:hypothetical protein